MEASGQSTAAIQREFEDHRFGATTPEGEEMEEGDVDLFRAIVDGAQTAQARIDQMTHRALVARWPIDRIDPTLRAIFRAGGAELLAEKAPPRVVITEYVELARAFFPEGREGRFVNAILDHMAREAQPQAF
jgi:N utilization substance protein B